MSTPRSCASVGSRPAMTSSEVQIVKVMASSPTIGISQLRDAAGSLIQVSQTLAVDTIGEAERAPVRQSPKRTVQSTRKAISRRSRLRTQERRHIGIDRQDPP